MNTSLRDKAILSIEAKCLLAAFWTHSPQMEFSFRRPHIITPEAKKGFDDLIEAGFLTASKHDNPHNDTVYYKPTEEMGMAPEVPRNFLDDHNFEMTTE